MYENFLQHLSTVMSITDVVLMQYQMITMKHVLLLDRAVELVAFRREIGLHRSVHDSRLLVRERL